jgi:NADPH:quinone reductase
VVELPEEVDARTGAATLLQGMTAEYLCETTYPARSGDVALVHADAGGVGLLLIQLLKQKGVTVYTTVSTLEKAELVREAGADEAILYTEVNFVETIRSFTKGNGVHVVYDSVGKTTYEGSLNVLRPFGCWCSSDNQAVRSRRSIRSFSTKRVLSFLLGQASLIMWRTPPALTTALQKC